MEPKETACKERCGSGNPEDDSTSITAMDMAGVSLRAIQELTRIVKELETENEALKQRIEILEKK